MKEKVLLNIFIFNAVFSKSIVGTFLEDDIEESSNLLVREKRVINRIPGEDNSVSIKDYAYIVNIKKVGRLHCIGTILSRHTVITAARCAVLELSAYSIHSGSTFSYHGQYHNVTEKKLHGHSLSRSATFMTGIALFTVNPSFEYSVNTNKIGLHTGPVFDGMHGTIGGWGAYCYGGQRETVYPRNLRSITVPIMNHRDCVNIYRGYFEIKDEDVCTYHPQKVCGYTDAGAPLVIGYELVGVHIGVIETREREFPIKPDVFALLQHSEYRIWIRENIL